MRHESGTEAQRLAYDTTSAHPAGALPVLSTWEVTSGSGQGNKYTWGGNAWVQTRSGGMALVSVGGTGPQTEGVLREHATLTTTAENGTFTEAENVTQLKFNLFLTAAATTKTDLDQLLADAWVCFDPPSDAVGDLWLTQGDHLTDDALRYRVGMNEPLIVNFPAGYVGGYRIKAGHLATGQTIGCTVEGN